MRTLGTPQDDQPAITPHRVMSEADYEAELLSIQRSTCTVRVTSSESLVGTELSIAIGTAWYDGYWVDEGEFTRTAVVPYVDKGTKAYASMRVRVWKGVFHYDLGTHRV